MDADIQTEIRGLEGKKKQLIQTRKELSERVNRTEDMAIITNIMKLTADISKEIATIDGQIKDLGSQPTAAAAGGDAPPTRYSDMNDGDFIQILQGVKETPISDMPEDVMNEFKKRIREYQLKIDRRRETNQHLLDASGEKGSEQARAGNERDILEIRGKIRALEDGFWTGKRPRFPTDTGGVGEDFGGGGRPKKKKRKTKKKKRKSMKKKKKSMKKKKYTKKKKKKSTKKRRKSRR